VEGVRGVQAPGAQPPLLQPAPQGLDGLLGSRDHRAAGSVDGGERQGRGEHRLDLFGRQGHAQHGARGQALHQPPPGRHQGERGGQGENAGQAGRRVLADAVAEHGPGDDAPLHPHPGQGVFEDEQGRLRHRRLVDPPLGLFLLFRRGRADEQVAQVEP
jgi:hypothetical protein